MESSGCVKNNTFDPATGIQRQEIDEDCDGIVDRCVMRELNDYGGEVRYEYHEDCAKAPTTCAEIERNEYGEAIAIYVDEACNGRPDTCISLKRNDYGDLIGESVDKGCDGVLEEGEYNRCSTYAYDEDGRITYEQEGACGGEPENCANYEYDFAVGIRHEKWDFKCDGTADFCWVKIYRNDPWVGNYYDDPDDPDTFADKGCDGVWQACSIRDDNEESTRRFKDHEVCEKKYEDLVKRNRGRQ